MSAPISLITRAGQVLLRLSGVPARLQEDDSFYPVLGHLMGTIAQDRVPVVTGLYVTPSHDQLKALGAAAASSGTVALFHLVGITPEAPTLKAAFQGRRPEVEFEVTLDRLREARRELTTADGQALDMVVLGSPHFSLQEFRQLALLLANRVRHPGVQFLVTSSRAVRDLAQAAGLLEPLERFGGRLTVDTCILATPKLPASIRRLMTNSAKYAYYSPGLLNTQVTFGSLADCVNSAVEGRVVRDETLWNEHGTDVERTRNGRENGLPRTPYPEQRRITGQNWMQKMMSFMQRPGISHRQLSKMNFLGMGPWMMGKLAKQYNVAGPKELLEAAQLMGVEFMPCQMTMDMYGLTRDDLIEGMGEPVGAATVIGLMQDGAAPLFI